MRILITNDDGITAPGLAVMDAIAREIAGDDGEVWTVAPAFEQSGVGHCISYTRPVMLAELGPRRYAVEGSPADCILAALHDVMPEPPDLVLSGINRGNNAAQNVLYSGTVGAAIEAALQGLPAIAMSQFLGPRTRGLEDPFEGAAAWGARAVRAILEVGDAGDGGYRAFHNVNFPPVPAAEVRGLRAAAQGARPGPGYAARPAESPSGRRFLWLVGGDQQVPSEAGSDAAVNLDGWIAVTPMRADLTDRAGLDGLRAALDRPAGEAAE